MQPLEMALLWPKTFSPTSHNCASCQTIDSPESPNCHRLSLSVPVPDCHITPKKSYVKCELIHVGIELVCRLGIWIFSTESPVSNTNLCGAGVHSLHQHILQHWATWLLVMQPVQVGAGKNFHTAVFQITWSGCKGTRTKAWPSGTSSFTKHYSSTSCPHPLGCTVNNTPNHRSLGSIRTTRDQHTWVCSVNLLASTLGYSDDVIGLFTQG